MIKSFVLDTNVLLHSPTSLHEFGDNQVVIPVDVIEELDKFKTRTVVGVSFPYFLWTFRKCQTALAIEHAWLTLPLIRQGKPGRGTNAGRANQLHSQWRQDKKESRSSSWGAGHWQESHSWSDGHWRRSWR